MRTRSRGFLTLLLVGASSCGGTESPTDTGEPDALIATTLTLSPTALSFSSIGETQQLTATVRDQNGVAMSGASVSWASSSSSVASVSSGGLVTAVADGTATITATSGSATGSASATVGQVAASITLSPSSLVLAGPGATATVTASVMDAGGSVIASPTLTWSSDDEGVATVSDVGLVTGVASGNTTVRAEATGSGVPSEEIPVQVLPQIDFVNGGFDTDATGWTFVGNDGGGGYRASGGFPDGGFARINAAGACGSDPSVSQQLDGLGVGVSYTIGGVYRPFAPSFGSPSAESFVIRVGGAILLQLARGPQDEWTAFQTTFTASSTSALVEFLSEFGCDDSSYDLDNVSLGVNP